jgi:hypothetical protein
MVRIVPASTRAVFALVVAALTLASAAGGSIWIADGTTRASVAVDAHGNAQVTWFVGAARKTQLVPPQGRVLPGGTLTGPDVSRKVATPHFPLLLALRRTPDGRLWALQSWRPTPGAPTQLQLARWRGAPTQLTLEATLSGATELLSGTATFAGKPVTGFTTTPAGKRVRIYVSLECLACGGSTGWSPMLSAAPHADGSFRVSVQPRWSGTRYRATVAGPNVGTTLAPLAQAVAASSVTR